MVVRKPILPGITPRNIGELAVVTCHFNWAGFRAPAANLRRFLRQMRAFKIPVYGMELQMKGRPFVTEGESNWTRLTVSPDHMLFQKEACINAIVAKLPPQFKFVAWVDADVEFTNHAWPDIAKALLTVTPVIQLFDVAVWTDREGLANKQRKSCVQTGMDRSWKGHPGFAWAARRELWTEYGGLYAQTPIGHGDTIFALAAMKQHMLDDHGMHHGVGINPVKHDLWKKRIGEFTKGQCLFVPGECWHEWHGDLANRKYWERSTVLKNMDCEKHIAVDRDGLLKWSSYATPAMKEFVTNYFHQRKEDE